MGAGDIIRRGLAAIPWSELSLDEARALALEGRHLVEKGGQLIGAPRGVGMKELPALRGALDEAAAKGASGADWYDLARKANTEMSGGSPKVARELAAGQAVYSNQATPDVALGWTLGQRNASLLEGPEEAAKRTYHYGFQSKQYGDVLKGGDPAEALGPKTEPYFRQMDPNDEAAHAIGVNDTWMGRAYGHKERPGGFTESEHSFMTGENLLGRERADMAGILHEGTSEGVAPWQAAVWTGKRLEALRAKYPNASEEELLALAKASIPDAMEGKTAYETTEQVPSRASGHLATPEGGAVADMPLNEKQALSRRLRAAPAGAYDPYYEALGMAQRPSQEGLGQFTESIPDKGPPRFQPAFRHADGEVQATVGHHDWEQLSPKMQKGLDKNKVEAGFIDQNGQFYTREEAIAAANAAERAQQAAEAISRTPMRSKAGDELPYLGSKERFAWEDQYRKNVEAFRGAPGTTFEERDLPIDRIFGSHQVAGNEMRTKLYTRGYKEGAPPARLLVYEEPVGSGNYFILDGNRRLLAAQQAGLTDVPALVERKGAAPKLTSERLTTRETHFGEAGRAKTDYNPNQTMRPMVSFAPGTGKPAFGAAEDEMLRGANVLRSAVDVQAAGAVHSVKFSSVPRLQNAARVAFPEPLPEEMTAMLYERAQEVGLNLIDTGGGTFTVTGDFGQMPAGKFKKAFEQLQGELEQNGARVRLGSYVSQFNELPQYGEGRVTEHVLKNVTPRVGAKLSTPELKAAWLAKNEAEQRIAAETGRQPREDVQKLRAILGRAGKKGGVEGLRAYVLKYGTAGLPAVALGMRQGDER